MNQQRRGFVQSFFMYVMYIFLYLFLVELAKLSRKLNNVYLYKSWLIVALNRDALLEFYFLWLIHGIRLI